MIEHFANYPIKELTTLSLVAALAVVVIIIAVAAAQYGIRKV